MLDWISSLGYFLPASICVALIVVVLFFKLRRRKVIAQEEKPLASIAISSLSEGPKPDNTKLTYFGTPVRIALIVVAPSGRHAVLPPGRDLLKILEAITPSFGETVEKNAPVIRRWPAQLSVRGFAHAFFNGLEMPGNRGKGTVWSAVSGRVEYGNASYLVGITFCSNEPNALSEHLVEHPGEWLSVLRAS